MEPSKRILAQLRASLLVVLMAPAASAQPGALHENAALRYWMAFALMQDLPAGVSGFVQFGVGADGKARWDEANLGPLLDANAEALRTMYRGTAIAECDWGVDYDLGAEAPIAHLARARALGRLSVLDGMRALARDDGQTATDIWIAGLRFSRHVASGGGLIAALTGRAVLGTTFMALTGASNGRQLDSAQRKRLLDAVQAIGETGFDWGAAYRREGETLDALVDRLRRDPSPARGYERAVGTPPPQGFSLPSNAASREFRAFVESVAEALQLSPTTMESRLAALQRQQQALHPFYRSLLPSLEKTNQARAEVKAERQRVLDAMSR